MTINATYELRIHNRGTQGKKYKHFLISLLLSITVSTTSCHSFSTKDEGIAPIKTPHGPSFDCTKASLNVEKMICSDTELSELDTQLNEAYKQELAEAVKVNSDEFNINTVKKEQNDWLRKRNKLNEKSSIENLYKDRITKLYSNALNIGVRYSNRRSMYLSGNMIGIIGMSIGYLRNTSRIMLYTLPFEERKKFVEDYQNYVFTKASETGHLSDPLEKRLYIEKEFEPKAKQFKSEIDEKFQSPCDYVNFLYKYNLLDTTEFSWFENGVEYFEAIHGTLKSCLKIFTRRSEGPEQEDDIKIDAKTNEFTCIPTRNPVVFKNEQYRIFPAAFNTIKYPNAKQLLYKLDTKNLIYTDVCKIN